MDALTKIVQDAIAANPSLLTALLRPLPEAQPVAEAPKVEDKPKGKRKAKEEDLYTTVASVTLTEYLHVSLSVKRTGQGDRKRGYAFLSFNNPKRQGDGTAAYGKVWLYRKEFVALCNWLRDAKFTDVLAKLDASGLTNA